MRDLAEKIPKRIVGVFLVLLPIAAVVSFTVTTGDDTDALEDDAVAFVLNQSPEKFPPDPDSELSTRPNITAQTPETTTRPNNQTATPEAPTAQTATTTIPDEPRSPNERGQTALSKISFAWAQRLPDWEISFHPERSGVYGYTLVNEQRIEVYVRSSQSDELLAHVIAHEIGHAIDVTHNNGDDRNQWLAARGIEETTWWPNDGASDFSTGAGDFAESFAAWQVGTESFRSKLGPAPNKTQLDVIQQLAIG